MYREQEGDRVGHGVKASLGGRDHQPERVPKIMEKYRILWTIRHPQVLEENRKKNLKQKMW